MTTTTLSGPADTIREAREQLRQAGYWVMSRPTPLGIAADDGEAFLSVEGGHSDVAAIVEDLGWRHRACTGPVSTAIYVPNFGGQG